MTDTTLPRWLLGVSDDGQAFTELVWHSSDSLISIKMDHLGVLQVWDDMSWDIAGEAFDDAVMAVVKGTLLYKSVNIAIRPYGADCNGVQVGCIWTGSRFVAPVAVEGIIWVTGRGEAPTFGWKDALRDASREVRNLDIPLDLKNHFTDWACKGRAVVGNIVQ